MARVIRNEMGETARKPMKTRRFGRVAKFALALGAAAAVILACELAARWLSLAPKVKAVWLSNEASADVVYRRSANPILGFELKPGYRNENADHRTTYSSTNSHGQRDVERTTDKPPGTRRVIVLGDSVVEGHGLPDIDATISRQLERVISDGRTEVLNFGVSGYCTRSEIELLETKGLQFEPDVVILVFVENDFDNFSPEAFQLGTAVDRPALVKHLFVDSHLFRLTCLKLNLFRFGDDADPLKWNQRAIGENNVVTGFARFRELAEEHGFLPLVAVWPHFDDSEIQNLPLMPDGSGDLVVERVAELYGLPTVRLSEGFAAHWKSLGGAISPRQRYTVEGDQLHPNEEAATVAAEALRDVLVALDAGKYRLSEPAVKDPAQRSAIVAAALSLGKEHEPDYAMVYVNDGRSEEQKGNFAAAAELYLKALEADPECFPAVNNLGVLYARQGRLQDAVAQFERARSIRPNSADVHNNLGNLYLAVNNLDEAARQFETALRIRPDYVEALCSYGGVLARKNDVVNADIHLRRAIEIDPNYVKAYHNLGILLATIGDTAESIEQFRRAIAVDPNYAPGHANLGHLLLQQKQYAEAEKSYRRALDINPNLSDVQQGLAQLRQMQAAPTRP